MLFVLFGLRGLTFLISSCRFTQGICRYQSHSFLVQKPTKFNKIGFLKGAGSFRKFVSFFTQTVCFDLGGEVKSGDMVWNPRSKVKERMGRFVPWAKTKCLWKVIWKKMFGLTGLFGIPFSLGFEGFRGEVLQFLGVVFFGLRFVGWFLKQLQGPHALQQARRDQRGDSGWHHRRGRLEGPLGLSARPNGYLVGLGMILNQSIVWSILESNKGFLDDSRPTVLVYFGGWSFLDERLTHGQFIHFFPYPL